MDYMYQVWDKMTNLDKQQWIENNFVKYVVRMMLVHL